VGTVFGGIFASTDYGQVADWFELGGTLQVEDTLAADDLLKRTTVVQGLHELAQQAGLETGGAKPLLASAVDFVLEGLYAHKKISRSEDRQYQGIEQPRRPQRAVQTDALLDRELPMTGNKKKYYN
jgi:magnesium chelatase subunit I